MYILYCHNIARKFGSLCTRYIRAYVWQYLTEPSNIFAQGNLPDLIPTKFSGYTVHVYLLLSLLSYAHSLAALLKFSSDKDLVRRWEEDQEAMKSMQIRVGFSTKVRAVVMRVPGRMLLLESEMTMMENRKKKKVCSFNSSLSLSRMLSLTQISLSLSLSLSLCLSLSHRY